MEAGTAYKLALPTVASRRVEEFPRARDQHHPVMTDQRRGACRPSTSLPRNLGKAASKIDRESPLLPDFAASSRLLHADAGCRSSRRHSRRKAMRRASRGGELAADDMSLAAERLRRHRAQPPRLLLAGVGRARLRRSGANCSRLSTR